MRTAALAACVAFGPLLAQDHVGQPVPQYPTGGECLFCHRGPESVTWEKNPHARTVRLYDPDEEATKGMPKDTTHILGAHPPFRGLKEDGYGTFDLLEARGGAWDRKTFAAKCAGCHTTAVDPKTRAFSTASLDCFTCHGIVPQEHAADTTLVWFSRKQARDPKLITAACGQCHLRGGKSKASGLPYANNFVPGDNLFRDFEIDFSKADDKSLNPGDRHIYRNARDVLQKGSTVNCLSCHKVHENSTARHRFLDNTPGCLDCHYPEGPMKTVKKYEVHSEVCGY
jgi:hypothetical protein